MEQSQNNNPRENMPYWMQALTDQEIEDLSRIQMMVVTEDLDINMIEDRAFLLVARLASLFNESEEVEIVTALSADDFEDEDDEDE